ncbi:hypothetical protein V7L32_003783 [Salmonella enterica]
MNNKEYVREDKIDNISNGMKKRDMQGSGRLQKISVSEKRFLDNAVSEAARVKGKKLTAEERRKVLCVARLQIRSQRKADEIKRERDKERHAAEFEWKKTEPFRR